MAGYPGYRFHHTKDRVVVADQQDEDNRAPEQDGWRDTPYSDEEKADIQDESDVQMDKPAKPVAKEFNTIGEFKEAQAKYKSDMADWKKAGKGQ